MLSLVYFQYIFKWNEILNKKLNEMKLQTLKNHWCKEWKKWKQKVKRNKRKGKHKQASKLKYKNKKYEKINK